MTEPALSLQQLAELVARIARTMHGGDDAAARTAAAAEVEQLRQLVARTTGQIAPAGFDLAQIGDALRLFADWLRAPGPATEAPAERAITDLQAALGPLVGWDPAREDAARRDQYRREARAALDDYFAGKPKKP